MTKNKYDFNKHCKTKKHKEKLHPPVVEDDPPIMEGRPPIAEGVLKGENFVCKYCKEDFLKKNRNRHYNRCKSKKDYDVNSKIKELEQLTNNLQERLDKKDEQFVKKIYEMDSQFKELQSYTECREKEMIDFMKTIATNNQTNITNNNCNNKNTNYNMYYVINNFTEAENIEDIMKAPFTKEELDYIEKNGSILGSYNLIKGRCVEDKDVSKRPVHCSKT
jgi:DNA-binding phage protein